MSRLLPAVLTSFSSFRSDLAFLDLATHIGVGCLVLD